MPLNDDNQFFSAFDGQVIPAGSLVAMLPRAPAPAGGPGAPVYTYRGPGLAAWRPAPAWWTTSGIAVEDVRVSGGQQPAVLLGGFGNARLTRVTSDDGVLQGLGTLPLMV